MREGPFTPSEQSRIDRLLDLADRLGDLVTEPGPSTSPIHPPVTRSPEASSVTDEQPDDEQPEPRPEPRAADLRRHADGVVAEVEDRKVGEAGLVPLHAGWGLRVYVHPAWRRRGLGLQLLREVCELAVDRGIWELDVRLDAHDLVGLRLVLASGLCGSVSCEDGVTRTRLVLARRDAGVAVPARG